MPGPRKPSRLVRAMSLFGWTRHSFYLLSAFVLVCGLIVYVWWPLAEEYLAYMDWKGAWWLYFDWLLVGIWLAMSLLIMAKANLKVDAKIVFVATLGGLVIEGWGTQTNLWHYYTTERPPLWIIPAWPIAALATDRLVRLSHRITRHSEHRAESPTCEATPLYATNDMRGCFAKIARSDRSFSKDERLRCGVTRSDRYTKIAYWLIYLSFYAYMLFFVAPTFDKSLTLLALLLCALLILTPTDPRWAVLTFVAGAGLGYFLEVWGTTRECWSYYTMQKPPFFAVLAHGMASVAFWRTGLLLEKIMRRLRDKFATKIGRSRGFSRF